MTTANGRRPDPIPDAPTHDDLAAAPSPYDAAAAALRAYLDAHTPLGVVEDPWTRVLDGFLISVHEARWPGLVRLEPGDLGLDRAAYAALARRLRWGALDLLPDGIGKELEALVSRARRLPRRWGVAVHWGLFVPLRAMDAFRREWDEIAAAFDAAVDRWVVAYDAHRAAAEAACREFAARSARVAGAMGLAAIDPEALAQRLMAAYPPRDALRQRHRLRYETAFIPTPALVAEQANYLEALAEQHRQRMAALRASGARQALQDRLTRLELEARLDAAERAARLRDAALRAEAERIRADVRQRADALLAEFERTYALDLRRRLHDALHLLIAALQRGGSSASATRSVVEAIADLRLLAREEDVELQALMTRLEEAIATRRAQRRRAASRAAVLQTIEDVGAVLQASILALGGGLRRHDAADADDADDAAAADEAAIPLLDLADPVGDARRRVQRLGIPERDSLAVALTDAAAPAAAAVRRTRLGAL